MTQVLVPKVGMSATEVEVITIHVQVGQAVSKGDPVVDVGADKVDFTIESDTDGVVAEILVAEGDVCDVGAPLLRIEPAT
jgi:pyruvate/2-oxoglutarate dehydrogenase complex dihydrolipoamide acyltransferase (E2) component